MGMDESLLTGESVPTGAQGAGGAGGSLIVDPNFFTGNGTSGSPLSFNPAAARGPDWTGACKAYFQQQTGLAGIQIGTLYESDFANTSLGLQGSGSQGFIFSGGTATAAYGNPAPAMGGIVKVTGPNTGSPGGATFSDWLPASNQSAVTTLSSLSLKRWATFYRVAVGTAPVAASNIAFGVLAAGTIVGLGYSGAASHWQYVRGAIVTNIAATGVPITVSAAGTSGYLTMCLGNFDLQHVAGNADIVGSGFASPTQFEALSNLPANPAFPYGWNEGSDEAVIWWSRQLTVVEL